MTGPVGHILRGLAAAIILVTTPGSLRSQSNGLTVHFSGTYTTTAKLYPNPTSPSPFLRNEYNDVEDLTGLSAEVRYPINGAEYSIGFSVGYISHVDRTTKSFALGGSIRSLRVNDGFALFPVELSGIAVIPLQSESYHLSMSGGGGVYIARRIYDIEDAGIEMTDSGIGYGIHVSVTFGYRLLPGTWIQFASTFRDPDVTVEYVFDRSAITVDGTSVPLPTSPMKTRVNVDGMTLTLGVMVEITRLLPL